MVTITLRQDNIVILASILTVLSKKLILKYNKAVDSWVKLMSLGSPYV